MEKTMGKGTQVIQILKALLASYVVTGILLLLLTLLLYKFEWDEQMVTAGIIVIYIVSTFVGGFIMGKLKKARKFVWGLVTGLLYFVLLFLISFCVYRNFDGNGTNLLTTLLLCVGGGMLGGMLA
ncbi:MAG: TIGR04086 family membrane protein [Faecalimonas sp.]|nr:TIGR04086 family membrane protein [Faecalimonas sp.]